MEKGADIVDLGVPLDAKPADVEKVVRVASDFGVPLSIDTFLPPQIAAALNAGVDMVMSLSGKNLETVSEHVAAHDVAAVLIPDEPDAVGENKLVSAEDRVRSLLANIKTARKDGTSLKQERHTGARRCRELRAASQRVSAGGRGHAP